MFEPIRAALPEVSLIVEPVLDEVESFPVQSARPDASYFGRANEPARLETADVFEEGGKRDRERRRQFTDACRTGTETPDDCSPRRISEGGEHGVEFCRMVSHKGKYYRRSGVWRNR